MTIAARHPYDAIIGGNVKKIRMLHGKSQTALANHLNITFQQVQKYEKGSNRIGSGRLCIIAEFLDVPLLQFFSGISKTGKIKVPAETYRDTRQGMDLCAAMDGIESQAVRRSIEALVKNLPHPNH